MIETKLTEPQVRVLGSMIEKQITTPMNYPMTQNAIRVACNQKSNRDPVVDYSEDDIWDILQALQKVKYVEIDLMDYSRTSKYNQQFSKVHDLERGELVILCELFIRGAQTPGELRSRCERMYKFKDLADVERCLALLVERGFIVMLERLPGTKEHRWAHLFCGEPKVSLMPAREAPRVQVSHASPAASSLSPGGLEGRVASLEAQLRRMEERLEALEKQRGP